VYDLLRFFKRLRRKSSSDLLQKNRAVNPFQRQLDAFQTPPQEEKKRLPVQEISIKELESEVNKYLKDFQSYIKRIKETSLRLDELTKLLKSGEISENAYRLIMNELGELLSLSVEDMFSLREVLEIARARAKLEWAKEKIGLMENPTLRELVERSAPSKQDFYPLSLQRWEDLISKIDDALSSLSIEEEASITERYLSLLKEKLSLKARREEVEKGISICQQRLSSISDRWASIRRNKIEQIMNLELKASQIKDEIKETEVRFSVGELDQSTFEAKMSTLQGTLKKVEREISDTRNSIDDMDMKIFRCSELLRESL